ncbi:MAG: 30S ribosome-binding factor RbfA [Eubacteriales bacterium]|nr:30S ribosome-binding factor RbfA [Lachnospiraceae bacterium]MDD5859699.1 30S ribosome-binding factor RbfA [Eubacteriales bacterium]MCH4064307.1 30S ribosome-binding factor RbfA [Lachnospiraceae bacterium]MCH4102968.1 30S ribosome-binding factor RbfA [Lachnospiraceae bacterium]MCI1308957.1 30S ribosome-binding factor RbfA [Lachnospiraceae bacterium]
MRKNSPKNKRINEEVAHELSQIIRDLKDPRISFMTSVMDAYVSTDLKNCKVYVSVLGDEKAKTDTMKGLESAKGFIRHELAETLNMRNTPELTFVLDESIERGVRMSKLIDDVAMHDEKVQEEREETEEADQADTDET